MVLIQCDFAFNLYIVNKQVDSAHAVGGERTSVMLRCLFIAPSFSFSMCSCWGGREGRKEGRDWLRTDKSGQLNVM